MNEQERARQIKEAVHGDKNALQALIVEYHETLRTALEGRMRTGVRRHVDADDVLQDAYVAAFKAIRGCRSESPGQFYRWLESIATNALKDFEKALRRQKRDAGREVQVGARATGSYHMMVEQLAATGTSPSGRLHRSEAVAVLVSSLARLTDDQREVVKLRFLEGLSVAEIAKRLDKSSGAVHVLCHRGLRALEDLMGSITQFLSRL